MRTALALAISSLLAGCGGGQEWRASRQLNDTMAECQDGSIRVATVPGEFHMHCKVQP